MNKLSQAAAILGAKGGKAGSGKSKTRTREQYLEASRKSWASRRMTTQQRIDANTQKGNANECWLWIGHIHHKGYGTIWIGGKNYRAHRVVWEIVNGDKIPQGLCVCHKCDNPKCCNPNHLFIGTHADNMRDAQKKGKFANRFGEKSPRAKITNDQAAQIRAKYVPRIHTRQMLSKEFGIGVSAIKDILSGRHFSHAR